jgi:plastocyanin
MRSRSMKFALVGVAFFALSFAVACGSSSSPTVPTPPSGGGGGGSAGVTVSIAGQFGSQSYVPSPVNVKVGQSVAWHNNDSIGHTASGDSGSFDSGFLGAGATSNPVTMSTAGTFTYHCQIHPGMVGTLNVQ